jgi:hypothetical protein
MREKPARDAGKTNCLAVCLLSIAPVSAYEIRFVRDAVIEGRVLFERVWMDVLSGCAVSGLGQHGGIWLFI